MIWNVDPVIARVGPFTLRWYSLSFALGFIVGYFIVKKIFQNEHRDVTRLDSLLAYLVIATLVGARLGQVLFYEPGEYLRNPVDIIKIWEGGLASHGGFAGVLIALQLFCRRHRDVSFLWLAADASRNEEEYCEYPPSRDCRMYCALRNGRGEIAYSPRARYALCSNQFRPWKPT